MSNITQKIRQEVSILDYLRQKGYTPIEKGAGRYYTLKEHDSFIYTPARGQFIWNSRTLQGSIIDLYMELEGVDLQTAIRQLSVSIKSKKPFSKKAATLPKTAKQPPKAPKLSYAPQYWRNLYAFLGKTRGIEPAVVQYCVEQKIIYPAAHSQLDGLPFFYYYSPGYPQQTPYAAARCTYSQYKVFHVANGSNCDCRFSIGLTAQTATELFVAEACLDLLSIMSLLHRQGLDFRNYAYLSLEGSTPDPLLYHQKRNPQLQKIYLAQDNDPTGEKSRTEARALLQNSFGGALINLPPPAPCKDWNDFCLQYTKEKHNVFESIQSSV